MLWLLVERRTELLSFLAKNCSLVKWRPSDRLSFSILLFIPRKQRINLPPPSLQLFPLLFSFLPFFPQSSQVHKHCICETSHVRPFLRVSPSFAPERNAPLSKCRSDFSPDAVMFCITSICDDEGDKWNGREKRVEDER